MITSYDTSITLASANITDAIASETTGELLVVENTSNTFRKFSQNSGVQTGSAFILTGPRGIAMVDTLSAAIGSSSNSTMDLIEVSSGYRTNVSGGTTMPTLVKNQLCAADTTNKIVLFISSTSRTLGKMNASAGVPVGSTITVQNKTSGVFKSIIFKGNGRFLVGDDRGGIYEIDSSGIIYDQFYISTDYTVPTDIASTGVSGIQYMSLDGNLLLVTSQVGMMYLIDISTKVIIDRRQVGINLSSFAPISNSYQGVCLKSQGWTTTYANTVCELDFAIDPVHVNEPVFHTTGNTNLIYILGINTTNGKGWAVQTSNIIHFLSLTVRASTTRAVTSAAVGDKVELIIVNTTDSKISLNTFMKSPASYRVPTGKSFYEIIKKGKGTNAGEHVSKYTT
jgi:hypothetical protein